MTLSPTIRSFWRWFNGNADAVALAYDTADLGWLHAELSPRVSGLGSSINWEIGPYHHPDRTLVLSPTLRENLPITRSAVASAPTLDGWRFLHSKPAKDLARLEFAAGGHTCNADGWHYVLTAYAGGDFVDIDLYLDCPVPTAELFCELVVEALIGEEDRLERVGCVTPHVVTSSGLPTNATPIPYLRYHLDETLGTQA